MLSRFDQIPVLIKQLLVDDASNTPVVGEFGTKFDTVVLLLIDGFGHRLFEKYADQLPFLQRFKADGLAQKIRCQFPSTTAAHVTTLHTGLPVGRSGVPEWRYYEPVLDRVFSPLPFVSDALDGEKSVSRTHAARLFPNETLYRDLGAHGIDSVCLQRSSYAGSAFSAHVCRGARQMPYRTTSEAAVNLSDWLKTPRTRPAYAYVYFDVIDSISHAYGPDSPQVEAELQTLFGLLERIVSPVLSIQRKTCVMLTADHGLTAVGSDVLYLDQLVPALPAWMQTTQSGHVIAPTGGKRDLFLHIKAPYLDEALGTLTDALRGQATVRRTDSLIAQGLFGEASEALRAKLGTVIVLPGSHRRAWWSGQGRYALTEKKGDHGGLTPDEMEIPFLALPCS